MVAQCVLDKKVIDYSKPFSNAKDKSQLSLCSRHLITLMLRWLVLKCIYPRPILQLVLDFCSEKKISPFANLKR